MRKRQAPGRHRDVVDGKFAARKVQIQNWVGISKDLTQATLQDYKLPDSNMCDVTYPFAFIHDLVSNKFDACQRYRQGPVDVCIGRVRRVRTHA